jgi:hypothetical protein
MAVVSSFTKSAEISGPTCLNGGRVVATVLFSEQPGKIVIAGHAECWNGCLEDNLEPSVAVDIVDVYGNTFDSLTLEIPTVPAKSWPWNYDTVRSINASITLTNAVHVGQLRFSFRNRAHGIPLVYIVPFDQVLRIGPVVGAALG